MGSRMGRRIVNFANMPLKLLMPSSFTNITEIAFKTIPSASKIEIKRVLESLYGFKVDRVHTLNMDGKKKKRGGILLAKPDYKKAYVTLRSPLSLNPDLYPIKAIEEEREKMKKQSKSSIVEDPEAVNMSHWLDEKQGQGGGKFEKHTHGRLDKRYGGRFKMTPERRSFGDRSRAVNEKLGTSSGAKFPWSSMKSFGR